MAMPAMAPVERPLFTGSGLGVGVEAAAVVVEDVDDVVLDEEVDVEEVLVTVVEGPPSSGKSSPGCRE
jgi:hypothetical protein